MERALRFIRDISYTATYGVQIMLNLFIIVVGTASLVMMSLIAFNVFKNGLLPLINHVR